MALASVSADEIIPDGMAIIPNPIMRIINVKILPPMVIGITSPYPTVVSVTTDHQRLEKMEEMLRAERYSQNNKFLRLINRIESMRPH